MKFQESAKKYDLDFKNPKSDQSKWKTGDEMLELYQSFIKVASISSYFFLLSSVRLWGNLCRDELSTFTQDV